MVFFQKNKRVEIPIIHTKSTILERVTSFELLGVTLTESLHWKCHTDKICNKISRTLGILNKLKNTLPTNIKILIYNSLILSHINYGILIWGYHSERLNKLQKKAIRIISKLKYNSHTEPHFKQLHLLRINDILNQTILKFYFKLKNNKLPNYFTNFLPITNDLLHTHATRINEKLHMPLVRQEFARKSLRFQLPLLVNGTPNQILSKINTHSIQGYSNYIKNFYISKYEDRCKITKCYICSRNQQ